MDDVAQEISRAAARVVAMSESRDGRAIDYSEASLKSVEEMLEEAASFVTGMTENQVQTLAQDFGCYILEVARRQFGGRYCWFEERDQPVLVVGEPEYRVSLLAWDKAQGRLSGDPADNIPFFYEGFAERVRRAEPDTDVLYV